MWLFFISAANWQNYATFPTKLWNWYAFSLRRKRTNPGYVYTNQELAWSNLRGWVTCLHINKPSIHQASKWSGVLAIHNYNLNYTVPGRAMLAFIDSACFFFHFLISLIICSFFSGLRVHRHPFLCDVPWGRSNLQKALLSDKLWRTEFC